jgi:streptothricin hydrolase
LARWQDAAMAAMVDCLILVDLQTAFASGPNAGAPGTEDEPGTPGWALFIEPAPGETIIRRLAITGVMSEMCVSATARSALYRGLAVVLPHDAHATYDIPAAPRIAPAVPAAMVSRVAEWALGDQLELVATSRDVLFTAA